MDEVALNVLIAEGLDVPTAFAASVESAPPGCECDEPRISLLVGLVVGVGIGIMGAVVYWLLF